MFYSFKRLNFLLRNSQHNNLAIQKRKTFPLALVELLLQPPGIFVDFAKKFRSRNN